MSQGLIDIYIGVCKKEIINIFFGKILSMDTDDNKMVFLALGDNHVLQPQNETAVKAQNLAFELLENLQEKLINEYDKLSDDEKYKKSNHLFKFFVDVLMNKDQVSFKFLLGSGDSLMNNEELKNIKRDFVIAKKKKESGEYKTFLLLDLSPHSNRRADAIIISNEYKIELYDFSEGTIVEKLKKYQDNLEELSEKEKEQLRRKNKQQERISSFRNKIDMSPNPLEDVIIDNEKVSIKYYDGKLKLFDFNNAYKYFLKKGRERVYIPDSICFLSKKDIHERSDLFVLPLKRFIDAPHFTVEDRSIENEIIEDIYKHDTSIVFSRIYFFLFFGRYTSFEIILDKKIEKHQVKLIIDGKNKGVTIKDSRTNKSFPLTHGLLFKHAFINMSLKSWCEYMSALCNNTFDDKKFNQASFYEDKIKKECSFFNI